MENILFLDVYLSSMISKSTDAYNLYFYEDFVIAEAKEDAVVNSSVTEEALKIMWQHFSGNPFTIISRRTNKYTISESAYSPRLFKKVTAMAIVSKDPEVKERAYKEQLLFNNSFAFFEEIEEAVEWARNFKLVK
ncbi:hypothetical protein LZ575_02215 [Antarcticibacterium sp. 1MA-6-2]|uniref:hypothetical protein n=1 Tax=Antarcticibacterium sp. 1MA-6-2 TaxID=2908210 RepID=UPI001F28E8A5|nr:hypothetical protein [Antarcticibacterium sp. 1MA-6-2]UJH91563.1 hypothetical protein LZ575_02215 [Antarcticibacterium sp. 1MA-6-2]